MAAPSFQAVSALATGTAPSASCPTTASGDLLLLHVYNRGADAAPSSISGTTVSTGGLTWTLWQEVSTGGILRYLIYQTRATGDHSGQTAIANGLTDLGSHAWIGTYRGDTGAIASLDTNHAEGSDVISAFTHAGFNTTVADTLLGYSVATAANTAFGSWTANGVAMAERLDTGTANGGDSRGGLATLAQASAGATGTFSVTGGGSALLIAFAVKNDSAVTVTVPPVTVDVSAPTPIPSLRLTAPTASGNVSAEAGTATPRIGIPSPIARVDVESPPPTLVSGQQVAAPPAIVNVSVPDVLAVEGTAVAIPDAATVAVSVPTPSIRLDATLAPPAASVAVAGLVPGLAQTLTSPAAEVTVTGESVVQIDTPIEPPPALVNVSSPPGARADLALESFIDTGPEDGELVQAYTATFTFHGTGHDHLQVSIDSGTWTTETSPYTTPTLALGVHTFAVRAVAADLTVDPTPAMRSWIVDLPRVPLTVDREAIPLWLAVEAINADGRKVRWGHEELAEMVATGLGFSTSLPGGFAQGNTRLPRDLRETYHDVGLLRDIRFYGPASRTAYEGRIQEVPGSGGGADSTLEVLAEGHAAHLKDDNSFTEIYVDRDLRNWQGVSLQRQLELLDNGNDPADGSVTWDITSGAPAIVMTHDGAARDLSPISENWYDAGNQTIRKIYYSYAALPTAGSNSNYIPTDSNFNAKVGNAESEHVYTLFQATSDLAGSSSSAAYITFTTDRRYGWVQFSWNLGQWLHTLGYAFAVRWQNLTVYGDHGLTLVGSNPQGVYGSDVIADVLTRAAPDLTFTTGTDGSIEPSTFVIPHLLFRDPSNAETVILAVSALGGASNRQNDWGVYDGKQFFWRSPETYGKRWRVSVGATTTLQDEGPQIEDAINGIIVVWTDASGNTHTVGPTGSGLEATDASLLDTDTSNPANQAGLQRWPTLSIGTTTFAGAVQVGQLFLSEARQRKLRGEISHVGPLYDDKGVLHPPWAVRAGDTVEVLNLPDPGPFRIVGTNYNHDSLGVSMALDAPPARLEVMLERWTAVLAAAGI